MKTILIVEDDLAIARGLTDNLEHEGYRVVHEKDGLKGYERAKLEQPDLLILDVMLPTMDGFHICSRLKEEKFSAPIFMLTGLSQEESRLDGLRRGADDYIAKPFHLQELLFRVRNALKQQDLVSERAKRLETEFLRARKIQMASLPRTQPRMRGLDVYGRTVPAEQVGGDYYDYVRPGKQKLGIVVADVSGKGMPAAMYVQKIQGIVQSNAGDATDPAYILRALQQHMSDSMESSSFITAVVGLFDVETRSLQVAQAGHLPLLHIRDKKIRLLKPQGLWIGKTSAGKFEKNLRVLKVEIRSGDAILFYSDGLVEAKNRAGTEFGIRRVRSLATGKHATAMTLVDHYFKAVREFSGNEVQSDDITIVAIKVDFRHIHKKGVRR